MPDNGAARCRFAPGASVLPQSAADARLKALMEKLCLVKEGVALCYGGLYRYLMMPHSMKFSSQ